MFISVLLFLFGLLLLIKGGDWFVDGASDVAKRLRVPEILVGATVVSIGTTLPEVMVSTTSAIEGNAAFAYGNAIGSVICNAALISAVTLAVRPGKVDRKSLFIPTAFFFTAAAVYLLVSYLGGQFTRPLGIGLLSGFVLYMTVTVVRAFRHPDTDEPSCIDGETDAETEKKQIIVYKITKPVADFLENHPWFKSILCLVIGAAAIAWGADLLVEHGQTIAQALGLPASVMGLLFVALGTSLPELVTAITSLVKGHSSLSLGNIVGANLFNLVLVCGASVTISPFWLPTDKLLFGGSAALLLELPMMVGVMLILTLPPLIKGKVYRWQGISLLALYVAFLTLEMGFAVPV